MLFQFPENHAIDVFGEDFLRERKFAIGIFNRDDCYEVEFLHGENSWVNDSLVKLMKPDIPESYIVGIGEQLFKSLILKIYRIAKKPSCKSPIEPLRKLRKLCSKTLNNLWRYIAELENRYSKDLKKRFDRAKTTIWFKRELEKLCANVWLSLRIKSMNHA
jgi:hypothetical protein